MHIWEILESIPLQCPFLMSTDKLSCNRFAVKWNNIRGAMFNPRHQTIQGQPVTKHPRIPWYIPWKSRVAWHWIKWQSHSSMEFHRTKWYFIWRHQTSTEYSMEFHGTCVVWNGALLIPWYPMDLGDFFMIVYLATPEFRGIFLGSPG